MNLPAVKSEERCSREKLAAYLDGELEPREELILENHLANCPACLSELNLQKQMFSVLNAVFEDKRELVLPENFAKIIATRAETDVKGLRSKDERGRALFFCAVLFLLAVAGLGAQAAFDSFSKFGERLVAVLSFTGHLAYDLVIGLSVILRSVGNQPAINSTVVLLFLIGLFVLPAIVLSRYLDGSNRF